MTKRFGEGQESTEVHKKAEHAFKPHSELEAAKLGVDQQLQTMGEHGQEVEGPLSEAHLRAQEAIAKVVGEAAPEKMTSGQMVERYRAASKDWDSKAFGQIRGVTDGEGRKLDDYVEAGYSRAQFQDMRRGKLMEQMTSDELKEYAEAYIEYYKNLQGGKPTEDQKEYLAAAQEMLEQGGMDIRKVKRIEGLAQSSGPEPDEAFDDAGSVLGRERWEDQKRRNEKESDEIRMGDLNEFLELTNEIRGLTKKDAKTTVHREEKQQRLDRLKGQRSALADKLGKDYQDFGPMAKIMDMDWTFQSKKLSEYTEKKRAEYEAKYPKKQEAA